MSDPYSILGIAPTASDDEVKRAYRELAKKYHPDSYSNNPLSHLAEEKMKEVNEAYDLVMKQRQQGGGYSPQGSSGDSYEGGRSVSARAREQIARGEYSAAEILLDSVQGPSRNAEWHYLKGIVLVQRGWYIDAQSHLSLACQMDPFNAEFREALNRLQSRAGNARTNMGGGMGGGGCSTCDMCSGLICADCMCECCGGDLIGCC